MDNAASDCSAGGNGSTTSGGVGGESGNRMTSGGNSSGRQREVKTEEGEAFAKENDLLFVEASAKSGENVEHAFFTASKDRFKATAEACVKALVNGTDAEGGTKTYAKSPMKSVL